MKYFENEIQEALNSMILSASGWRGVFADCNLTDQCVVEESFAENISMAHKIISAAAALVFFNFLRKNIERPLILMGSDTRPTGKSIAGVMINVLLHEKCDVKFAGFTAAPEIMAWAKSGADKTSGFIYISASHNPVGYNGIKFGLNDGGVLTSENSKKIIADFYSSISNKENLNKIKTLIINTDSSCLQITENKKEAYKAYFNFCNEVSMSNGENIASALKTGLSGHPLGIVCDFNGSARCASIDNEFFKSINVKFDSINNVPGQIVHCIVPEGDSLNPCCDFLEKKHEEDSSFVLGYVPDCDGDRGNLVIWDEYQKKARDLGAQEVFALACVAEFSHLVWTGELLCSEDGKRSCLSKAAVTVNDPTSLRIDRIAKNYGISVFRAEVGEANVVSLARILRKTGYIVRILGEGSNGGNITHPSAVRDPINTVMALVKLLSVRSCNGKKGFFEIWCNVSDQMDKYRENFTLTDIIKSLPAFISTPVFSSDAVMRIKTKDHALLKGRYQEIFLREWKKRKNELLSGFSVSNWKAFAYNGINEKQIIDNKHETFPTDNDTMSGKVIFSFKESGTGGLRIVFFDDHQKELAFIWMRGSATEPVFRIMADVEDFNGQGKIFEKYLLDWQKSMLLEADGNGIN